MQVLSPTWYGYINRAMAEQGWDLDKTMEYVKDLDEPSKAYDLLDELKNRRPTPGL
jgi:hypothetical protein